VGAANSSSSNRLREIGTVAGFASYLIDGGSKLNPDWLKSARPSALRRRLLPESVC